jgi:uncharacterized protein (DUF362 family)
MAKGISIKFRSYTETVPRILDVIKLDDELKKHSKVVIKPSLRNTTSNPLSPAFLEEVLRYVLNNKNPDTSVFIAEGSDGEETMSVFERTGVRSLAEQYSVGLIDLNHAETENIQDGDFVKHASIEYPKILLESFVISLPKLAEDVELELQGSLSNMIGAFPAKHYRGFFSANKSKLKRWHSKYNVHDIIRCKMPDLAVIDASEQGSIVAGVPLDMDKIGAKLLGKEWKSISHLRMVDERVNSYKYKEDDLVQETETPSQ